MGSVLDDTANQRDYLPYGWASERTDCLGVTVPRSVRDASEAFLAAATT